MEDDYTPSRPATRSRRAGVLNPLLSSVNTNGNGPSPGTSSRKRTASELKGGHDEINTIVSASKRALTRAELEHNATKAQADVAAADAAKVLRVRDLQIKELELKCERLEKDKKYIQQAEEDAKKAKMELSRKLQEFQDESGARVREAEANLQVAQAKTDTVLAKLETLQNASGSTQTKLAEDKMELERQLHDAQEMAKAQQALAEDAAREREELKTLLKDAESRAALQTLGQDKEDADRILREELRRQAASLTSFAQSTARMNSELTLLRGKANKMEAMKEQNRTLNTKLKVMDDLRSRVAELEQDKEDFRRRERDWASLVAVPGDEDASSGFDGPQVALTKMKNFTSKLEYQVEQLKKSVQTEVNEASELRARCGELEDELGVANVMREEAQEERVALEKRAALLEGEVKMIKAHVRSYEQQEALDNPDFDRVARQRLTELESALNHAHSENNRLVTLIRMRGGAAELTMLQQDSRSDEQVQTLQQEVAALKSQCDELTRECAAMYDRVGRGNVNSEKIRVLSLASNPADDDVAIRMARLNDLRAENNALLTRLRNGGGESANWVPIQTLSDMRRTSEGLEKQVEELERSRLRLKQVFQAKTSEWTEAMLLLIGYKVKFQQNGQIWITSAFANGDDPGAKVIFEPGADGEGTLTVAHNDDGRYNQLKRFWIAERNSIPCFLANISLEAHAKNVEGVKSEQYSIR